MYRLIIIIVVFAFGCSKTEENKPTILSLKEMGDLATVEYTITKIIKASDNHTWYKIGDRKILMSCEAYLKAGIDMSEVSQRNFTIDGKNVHVILPTPKMISISLPPEKIKTEFQDVGMFRSEFNSNERNDLAKQAEKQIENSIESLGILTQAKANTSEFVTTFLKRLGYEDITISYADKIPVKINP